MYVYVHALCSRINKLTKSMESYMDDSRGLMSLVRGGRTYGTSKKIDEGASEASGRLTDLGAGVLRLDEGPELGDLEPLPFPGHLLSSDLDGSSSNSPFPGRPAASVRHLRPSCYLDGSSSHSERARLSLAKEDQGRRQGAGGEALGSSEEVASQQTRNG
jgi:hypothetical protein